MMGFAYIADALELVLLFGSALYLFSHADASAHRAPLVYFGFALAVLFIGDIYWIAHEIIRGNAVVTFSAIDIASAGFFLLSGSALVTMSGGSKKVDIPALVMSGATSLPQGLLWVMWNQDWVKDALGTVTLWYLVYHICRIARHYRLLVLWKRVVLIFSSLVVCALQVWSYLARDSYGPLVDRFCGIPLAAVSLVFIGRLVQVWKKDTSLGECVVCAFAGVSWAMCAMYLSYEPRYTAFHCLYAVLIPVATQALVRWVEYE